MNESLLSALTPEQRELFLGLTTPNKIQAFLDTMPYAPEYTNRCPLRVMQDRRAHCLDGAIFAAATLRQIGFRPLVVDLLPEPGMDDDHVLAIYKLNGAYGAVAQSNYVGLRFREAVYRSLRELVMSYFEAFFNVNGLKTMRWYSAPLNLTRFDWVNWTVSDEGADAIERILPTLPSRPLVTSEMVACLSKLDDLSMRGNMLEIDPAGIYQPRVA
jgi:hypothetical protein